MGVCDVPVISSVCDAVGEGATSLVAAPFDWLAQAMGGAGWLFEAVWSVFDATTMVDVTKPGYLAVYNLLFGIAVFVMLIFFCLQLITGLVRRDPTALACAALGLAKSVLGSFVVITLTALMLEVVDQLCLGIVQATGETTESMGDKITILAGGLAGINIAAPGVGAIITIFLAGVAITSAAIVWLSLLVRKALLLVAVVFAPLAFSGASWDAARGWEVFAGMLHHEFDRLEREQDRLMQAHYAAATTPTDGCATKPSSPRSTPTTNNCARGSRNRSPPSSARARPSATRERNPYRNTTTLRMSRVPVRHLGWSIGDSNP